MRRVVVVRAPHPRCRAMVHDDTPRIGLFFARVARHSRPETRVERAPRARGGSTRGRTFREGVVAAKAAILLVMVVKGDGCVRKRTRPPRRDREARFSQNRKRETPGAREILRRMRARMGTQSESLKPSSRTPCPKTLRGTGEANSAFDIFRFRRRPETKNSDVSPEVRFPSICGIRLRCTATESSRKRVGRFGVGGAVLRARRGRDGASTDARSVGSRDEAGEARHAGARLGRRRVVCGRGETRRRCA